MAGQGTSKQFIDTRKFNAKLRQFNKDVVMEITNVVNDIKDEAIPEKEKLIKERGKSASGTWEKEETAKSRVFPNTISGEVFIASYGRGMMADDDVRNVGTAPRRFFPNMEEIKKWMIIRGIPLDVLYKIARSIYARGAVSSKKSRFSGQSPSSWKETIYEKLADTLFNTNKIAERFNSFFNKWNK